MGTTERSEGKARVRDGEHPGMRFPLTIILSPDAYRGERVGVRGSTGPTGLRIPTGASDSFGADSHK